MGELGNKDNLIVAKNTKYETMTQDEMNTYYYFIGDGDPKGAKGYLKYLDRDLSARQAANQYEEMKESSNKNKAFGVVTNLAGGIADPLKYIEDVGQNTYNFFSGDNELVNKNSLFYYPERANQASFDGITEGMNDTQKSYVEAGLLAAQGLVDYGFGSLAAKVLTPAKYLKNEKMPLNYVDDVSNGLQKEIMPTPLAKQGEIGYNGGRGVEVARNYKPQNLMNELANSGVKYNSNDVVSIAKTAEGKLLWLENGNSSSGLKHITGGHAADFTAKGINDIPDFLNKTLQTMPIKTDTSPSGPYSEYVIDGTKYRVAFGTNGYIVSFYPIKK